MTLSAAIVGAGRMGAWHAGALVRMDGVRIVGVADPRREAAEALAAGTGAAVATDYRELLERTRPDVVYFCTPAHGHLEQIAFAAERGINVFVEKPLAATMAEANAAADAVDRHGVLCAVGYHWRYNPATDAAREVLGAAPITLLAGWWYWTIPPIPWLRDRHWGGGQIFDQATHLIDLMRLFAGEVATVYAAYGRNARSEAELPNWDANALTLRFAGGAVGTVHSTYALFPGIPNSNGVDVTARELLLRVNLGQTTVFRPDREPHIVQAPAGWNIDEAFIPILRRNDPAAIRSTAREAALSIAVSLAANYSAVTGRVVDLADFVANPPTDAEIMPSEAPDFAAAPTADAGRP